MKNIRKVLAFAVILLVVMSAFSVSVFAESELVDGADSVITYGAAEQDQNSGKLDMSLKPESFSDRLGYAVQGTVTGILMVFAVLTLLTLILYVSKYVFYDIPNKAKEKTREAQSVVKTKPSEPAAVQAAEPAPAQIAVEDNGELVAVITAAIAAMIESGEYKDEFVGGFRVVSFKRSNNTAWNRK